MKKAKRKLYSGHGIVLGDSPSTDDFRNDGRTNTTSTSQVKEGSRKTSTPTTCRNKNEGRLSRKSSMKRKIFQDSSLSLQRGMRDDDGGVSELDQRSKFGRSGRSDNDTKSGNATKKKQGDTSATKMLQGNQLESEASQYEVASQNISQNHRHISSSPGKHDHSINEDCMTEADKNVGAIDSLESKEAASGISEGLQNQPDDVAGGLETQEMFITQRDSKHKPKGLPRPFGLSRNLRGGSKTTRMRPADKQHHHTVSQVKQLKRASITQAVMVRHSSFPKHFLIPPSQCKNKSQAREKQFLRIVKELQDKRKTAGSQISSLEQSQGDCQLDPVSQLSLTPQELGSGTQMFNVSGEDPEPVVTESQSLIPPMIADDDSEEDPDNDSFREVLSMRLESRKGRRRRKNSGIFGLSPLEEIQEDKISDCVYDERKSEDEEEGKNSHTVRSHSDILYTNMTSKEREPVADMLRLDRETAKDGHYPEFSSQSTLRQKEGYVSLDPVVKEGIGCEAEEDVDVGSSGTHRNNDSSVSVILPDTGSHEPADNVRHPVGEGLLVSSAKGFTSGTKRNYEISAATSAEVKKNSTRMKNVIVLETQSERIEPGFGDEEILTQKNDVTVVPDSHDLTEGSLPRYHFTDDEESSGELHDESVTQAVSNFLNSFEDLGDETPPWVEAEGQVRKDIASKEKEKDNSGDILKGKETEQVKDPGQHISGSDESNLNSSQEQDKNAHVGMVEEDGDESFEDNKLDETCLRSGPVTRRRAVKTNLKPEDSGDTPTSGASKEVMKKLSHGLRLFEDTKGTVITQKDQDSTPSEGRKLPEGPNVISVRADVHVTRILMETEGVNEDDDSTTSPHKKIPSSAYSPQSRNDEGIVCLMEILPDGMEKGSAVDVSNVSTDPGDSSQETCLPEDEENEALKRLSTGSSCDQGGELEERKMSVGEVSSSVDTICKVPSSLSPSAGGILEASGEGLAGPSKGVCGKCNATELTATSAQTDITLQDLQSQEYFDFCLEFKRLLLEYEKSVITTSSSDSFGSSTSDSDSMDNCRVDVMSLVKRVYNSKVRDNNLSSDESTLDILKQRKRKRKVVDSSCQIGSPAKGLGESGSKTLSPKMNLPKEELRDSSTNQSVDVEEVGSLNDININATENSPCEICESPAAEMSSEVENSNIEGNKIKKGKKRKKNSDKENLGKSKKKKKKNSEAENSLEGRKEILKEGKTEKGKDKENLGKTKHRKRAKSSEESNSFFNIPIESLPSPEEVERQWKERRSKKNRKKGQKKLVKLKVRRKVSIVNYKERSSSDGDWTEKVTAPEKGLRKKRKKSKKKQSDPDQVMSSLKQSLEGSLDGEGKPEMGKEERKPGKRKKDNKHKKKKLVSDDTGNEAVQVVSTGEACLPPSPLELQWQYCHDET